MVREGVYACDALKYVSFGFSLSTPLDLDPYAFRSCRTLRTITLPTHLRSLGDTAFYQCYGSGITEIVIPSSTTSVYASCFRYCYNIKSIIVYGTIDSNSSYAFEYIYSLTNIEFLGSTTAMPQNILNGCSNLKYVKIPNTVTSIGSQAFGNMVNCTYDFTEFTSIPTCASDSFVGITGLSKIVIPDSLYSSWIAETNWVNYANNIYRASEVTI